MANSKSKTGKKPNKGNTGNFKFTDEQFILAIKGGTIAAGKGEDEQSISGSGGIISTIAARIGCDWHTAKNYIETHQAVREAYDDECQRIIDVAHSVLIRSIVRDYNTEDAKWYLTKKGKDRGFGDDRTRTTIETETNSDTGNHVLRIVVHDDDAEMKGKKNG